MNAAYSELLQQRLDGLTNKDFDLDVWKSGTALVLTRIFGEDNPYSREIAALKVDFSSWSLRDATADHNPRESCKKQGREILQLAIGELQLQNPNKLTPSEIAGFFTNKSGQLVAAIENKDEEALFNLLNKENKESIARVLAKLLC